MHLIEWYHTVALLLLLPASSRCVRDMEFVARVLASGLVMKKTSSGRRWWNIAKEQHLHRKESKRKTERKQDTHTHHAHQQHPPPMNISTSTFSTKRRGLKKVEDEENAATLHLGEEFQLKQINHQGIEEELIALNLSEARLVIKEALHQRKKLFKNWNNNNGRSESLEDDDDDDQDIHTQTQEKELQSIDKLLETTTGGNNQALKQTMVYLTNFSRFRDQETVTAVTQLLQSTNLHPFEIAQMGSLACEDADEAKTLIPSLNNKISDEDLERILKELSNLETLY